MLKFGLEIALGMIQKSDAAIFEILIFGDFTVSENRKNHVFCPQRAKNVILTIFGCRKISKNQNLKNRLDKFLDIPIRITHAQF